MQLTLSSHRHSTEPSDAPATQYHSFGLPSRRESARPSDASCSYPLSITWQNPQFHSFRPSQKNWAQPVTIGEGLPAIPGKLVKKIESGLYIDLSEPLPDCLSAANATGDTADAPKASSQLLSPPYPLSSGFKASGFIQPCILSKSQPHI